ncbi:MAG: F0F1 ATP synthase subunit A [Alphaproteobacteria bacterium]
MADPIHQFEVKTLVPLEVLGLDASLTNSGVFMVIAAASITAFFMFSISKRAIVPGRIQSIAELSYEFIADMIRGTAGTDGLKFFPFIFSLFMFILICNLLGMIPGAYTVTSQIVVTSALAAVVFILVVGYGFIRNGTKFLRVFAPSGIPWPLLIFIVPIEIFSFLSRPFSLSLRLFANMLAGHIMLKVIASFVVAMIAAGGISLLGALVPLVFNVALVALEFLIALLQAFVFAILSCIYLNDALHPGH